jgi:hypothetical protein
MTALVQIRQQKAAFALVLAIKRRLLPSSHLHVELRPHRDDRATAAAQPVTVRADE